MSLQSALASGRRKAEAMMVDTCLIRRITGSITNPDTGAVTPAYATVYAGKCRVQQRQESNAAPRDVAEAHLLMLRMELQLPMSATLVRADDEVIVLTSVDPDLLNRVFAVRDLAHKTHATARRIGIEERTS